MASEKITAIVEEIKGLSILELKELVKAGRLIAIGPKNQRQYILV